MIMWEVVLVILIGEDSDFEQCGSKESVKKSLYFGCILKIQLIRIIDG